MKKLLSLLKYVLLAISVVMIILVMVNGEDAVSGILRWAYVLLGLAIAASVLFPLFNLAQNPKGALRTIVGLGVVALIVGIAWAMSSDEAIVTAVDTFDKSFDLKITDTGLYTAYFALGAAVVVSVIGEIRNSFK